VLARDHAIEQRAGAGDVVELGAREHLEQGEQDLEILVAAAGERLGRLARRHRGLREALLDDVAERERPAPAAVIARRERLVLGARGGEHAARLVVLSAQRRDVGLLERGLQLLGGRGRGGARAAEEGLALA
jgi:hypothetical protein